MQIVIIFNLERCAIILSMQIIFELMACFKICFITIKHLWRIYSKENYFASERACQRFNNKALVTTLTLLSAIAAPAIIGFKKPKAASGMPIKL